jgi:uncharacterized protein (DUF2267 family)
MTAHLHTIDHAAQASHEWVRDLSRLLDWTDEHRTLRMLRVTLQALRDWLEVNESAQLAAQLPQLVRGLYYEGWVPARTPAKERTKEAFVARIVDAFSKDPLEDPEEAICSVFRLLNHHVSAGEVRDVRQSLPRHLRDLWPE